MLRGQLHAHTVVGERGVGHVSGGGIHETVSLLKCSPLWKSLRVPLQTYLNQPPMLLSPVSHRVSTLVSHTARREADSKKSNKWESIRRKVKRRPVPTLTSHHLLLPCGVKIITVTLVSNQSSFIDVSAVSPGMKSDLCIKY